MLNKLEKHIQANIFLHRPFSLKIIVNGGKDTRPDWLLIENIYSKCSEAFTLPVEGGQNFVLRR